MEVGLDLQDLGTGGVGRPDLCGVLQSGRAGDNFVWLGDMGDDPLDQSKLGGFPP